MFWILWLPGLRRSVTVLYGLVVVALPKGWTIGNSIGYMWSLGFCVSWFTSLFLKIWQLLLILILLNISRERSISQIMFAHWLVNGSWRAVMRLPQTHVWAIFPNFLFSIVNGWTTTVRLIRILHDWVMPWWIVLEPQLIVELRILDRSLRPVLTRLRSLQL